MSVITGTTKNDILAGGAGGDIIQGLAGNDMLDGGGGKDALIGGTGNDTYWVDDSGDVVSENAKEGVDLVKSTAMSYGLDANVENLMLIGSANEGYGNGLNNVITGNDGQNYLDGGAGKDTLIGGKGDDDYVIDDIGDKIVENISNANGGGKDTVLSTISFSLGGLANVENLVLKDAGGNINATGNALDNWMVGNIHDNVMDGGKGADAMTGGAGNDTYHVDNLGDQVFEDPMNGTDTVISTISLSTPFTNVERYVFNTATAVNFTGDASTQYIAGGSGNDTLSAGASPSVGLLGNGGNDHLVGGAQSDTLDGGKGADVMAGGDGSDQYHIDNVNDVVIEQANAAGADSVIAAISITKLADNVELAELAGKANLNLTGNDLGNTLYGNSGANIIDGGLGADTMTGENGNDTYIVDDISDTVNESAKGGIDLVKSSVSFMLGNEVENLTLTGMGNNTAIGNGGNNILTGNDGNNTLVGGAGNDTMIGGKGDDAYYVDSNLDKVVESVGNANGGGHDTVTSEIDFSLAGLINIEDLTLTGSAVMATGNGLANHILGNDLNNFLNGGAGADVLEGGKGDDTYYLDNAQDVVIELAGQGSHDHIISSVAFKSAVAGVEDYTFNTSVALDFTGDSGKNTIEGGSGNDKIDSGGSTSGDTLYGNAGDDMLSGSDKSDHLIGGTGADVMRGFDSSDVYYVDNVKDQVIEGFNQGNDDTVYSTISVSKTWDNVENVMLSGKANLNLVGNDLDNLLGGNSGKNTIDGGKGDDKVGGGAGDDLLTGGSGADTFVYTVKQSIPGIFLNGHDIITDFAKNEDKLSFMVGDVNHDNAIDLNDVLSLVTSVVDNGAGKSVDVHLFDGDVITFAGAGTGNVQSLTDLVGVPATQIEVQ